MLKKPKVKKSQILKKAQLFRKSLKKQKNTNFEKKNIKKIFFWKRDLEIYFGNLIWKFMKKIYLF